MQLDVATIKHVRLVCIVPTMIVRGVQQTRYVFLKGTEVEHAQQNCLALATMLTTPSSFLLF